MTKARLRLLWFVVAVLFFLAAMVRAENNAVYIAVGVVFLILSIDFNKRRERSEGACCNLSRAQQRHAPDPQSARMPFARLGAAEVACGRVMPGVGCAA